MAYETVNAQWPADTRDGRDLKPTEQEAVEAVRRLYRLAMKKPWKGKYKVTSGRRYTWVRYGTFYVNPDYRGGGWHELVHLVSHYCAHRLFPNAKGHGHQHAYLEREMIAHVVSNGWLTGALKRPTKPKAAVDRKTESYRRTLASLKRWEAKAKRAETALRKLRRARRRYERQGLEASSPA